MKRYIAALVIVLSSLAVASADEAPELPVWNSNLQAGYKHSIWTPGFRRDLVDFKTEGLENYSLLFDLTYHRIPIFFFHHEGPMNTTMSQQELFAENTQTAAFDKYQAGITLSWAPAIVNSDSFFLATIGRLTYIHTEETFLGDAIAVQPFAYTASGAKIEQRDDGTARFYDIDKIETGSSVSFRTKFKDDEISFLWPMTVRKIPFILRTGYYESSWYRPSDLDRTWRLSEDDRNIIYETKFRSRGIVIGIEPLPGLHEGYNLEITGHWGLDNDISNGVNRDFEVEEGEELMYAAGTIDCWYNYIIKDLFNLHSTVTIGASLNRRIFATEIHPLRGTWESDDILRLYAMLNIRL